MSGTVPHSYPTRRLPKQPSLEQLRNQAKDLFEQYRAGDPAVDGANIARTWRFAELGVRASYFGGGADWFSLVGGTIPFSRR
jgi:hypothetical protein